MRPFQTLPEFEHFTPEELDKVHEIIRSTTYAEARRDIHVRYGIKLSTNKLFRYLRKIDCAEELSSLDEDVTVSVNDYVNLLNGKPVPFSAAGMQVVLKRAFELACPPSTPPSLLKDLFRMFTYEDRQSLGERKFDLAERIQQFREDQAKAEKEKPKPLTPAEQTKRFREIFGMSPLTPRKNPQLLPPRPQSPQSPQCQMKNAQCPILNGPPRKSHSRAHSPSLPKLPTPNPKPHRQLPPSTHLLRCPQHPQHPQR